MYNPLPYHSYLIVIMTDDVISFFNSVGTDWIMIYELKKLQGSIANSEMKEIL